MGTRYGRVAPLVLSALICVHLRPIRFSFFAWGRRKAYLAADKRRSTRIKQANSRASGRRCWTVGDLGRFLLRPAVPISVQYKDMRALAILCLASAAGAQ